MHVGVLVLFTNLWNVTIILHVRVSRKDNCLPFTKNTCKQLFDLQLRNYFKSIYTFSFNYVFLMRDNYIVKQLVTYVIHSLVCYKIWHKANAAYSL